MTMQTDETCEKCPWHKHHGARAIRALTAVIVLIFVFWCGFQFGEIRAMVGQSHFGGGFATMRGGWTDGLTTSTAGPMLPVGVRTTTRTGTAPSTSTIVQ